MFAKLQCTTHIHSKSSQRDIRQKIKHIQWLCTCALCMFLSVLWHRWLGNRNGIGPLKNQYQYQYPKVRLYQTYIFPVLVYGLEAWTITKALDAFDTWSLQKILRIRILDTLPTLLSRRLSDALQFQLSLKQEGSTSLATFRFQARSSPSCQCIALTTKKLEETSRAPAYHLAEGDWRRCTVG